MPNQYAETRGQQMKIIASSRLHSVRLLILLACISLAQPFAALAQANAPEPLPPAAQEALNKGIIAAKVPDYLLAIRYFEDARKIAPDAPVIYLNLGLAESRIPGRELRAIAWFGAYLAAYPDAPNAAVVQEQIAVLEVKNQSNVSNFIKSVQAAARQMSGYKKNDGLTRVAVLWAKAGDIETALNTAELCEEGKSYAYYAVSDAQAKGGDIVGAQKTADMIFQQSPDMNQVKTNIVYAQSAIAEAQARAGDVAGAQRTFDFALRTSEGIEAGDRGSAMRTMVKAQARSGDIAGAQKTVDLMPDDVYKKLARDSIDMEARSGAANAQKSKSEDQPTITAYDWVRSLDDKQEVSFVVPGRAPPLKHAMFWDLAGHLKALNASRSDVEKMYGNSFKPEEDKKIFDDLHQTAEHLISAQNGIHKMLKQQAKK
jgi:tetratricopeptide (TPR) repeat protein